MVVLLTDALRRAPQPHDAQPPRPHPVQLWAPFPGPVGGVTLSADRLARWLRERDALAGSVDLRRPRAIAAAMVRPRARRHLFWCSTAGSVDRHLGLASAVRGERWLFVHGGDLPAATRLGPRRRKVFSRVFATNLKIAQHLVDRGFVNVQMASAHIPLAPAAMSGDHQRRFIVAVGHNRDWYGLDLALAAVGEHRGLVADASLTVLDYGAADDLGDLPEWCTVRRDVGPLEVADTLADHGVLLRPTSVDGDALIVREALDLGLDVVATDVVPRPAGVALAHNDVPSFSAALADRNRRSDGAGVGPSVIQYLEGNG